MFGSNKDLGFLKYVDEDNDVEGSVKEVWERNCLQQPLVRGTTVYSGAPRARKARAWAEPHC